MNQPTVSVVIPTYNSAASLGRAMESVIAQTFADWELIVVDDASMDATQSVVEAYREKICHDRLIYIRRPQQGGSSATRNTGIDRATGRFVAFLDADDEFLPNKLARQLALFDLRPELGLVYSDYSYVDLNGERHASVFDDLNPAARGVPSIEVAPGLHVCDDELVDRMIGRYIVSTITGMVRREVLATGVRFAEGQQYSEEWLFFLDVASRTRGGFVDEPLSLHHHTRGSVSRTSVMRNNLHQIRALEGICRSFPNASSRARSELYAQLATCYRQVGVDLFKQQHFGEAAQYFAGGLRYRVDLRGLAWWAQARLRRAESAPAGRLDDQAVAR